MLPFTVYSPSTNAPNRFPSADCIERRSGKGGLSRYLVMLVFHSSIWKISFALLTRLPENSSMEVPRKSERSFSVMVYEQNLGRGGSDFWEMSFASRC